LTIAVTFSLLKRLFPTFWIADLNSALPFWDGERATHWVNFRLSIFLFPKHLTKSKNRSPISLRDRRTRVIVENANSVPSFSLAAAAPAYQRLKDDRFMRIPKRFSEESQKTV
jgi:hypothetical protein